MKEEESKNEIIEKKKKSLQQMTQSKEPYLNQEFFLKEEEEELMVNAPLPPAEEVPRVNSNSNKWNNLEKDIDDSDFEMPEEALQCRMKKITKIKGNKRVKTIRRIFKMKDGTEEVHEDVIVDRI
jgi:hypothetical protein